MKVFFKALRPGVEPPAYATDGSAAMAIVYHGPPFCLFPGEVLKVGAGFAIHIEDPTVALQLLPRSSWGTKGLVLANLVGLLDSDYQGEVFIPL